MKIEDFSNNNRLSYASYNKRYNTANNLPLFTAEGYFGSRMDNGTASASRYIKTKNESYLTKIYRKEDKLILKNQTFESVTIEPVFYIPIIPMLLVHGNLGTSPGFKQFIMQRNPRELSQNIFNYLDDIELDEPLPYYKGFKGTIKKSSDVSKTNQYNFTGVFERTNTTTVVITEVPILSTKWGELKKNEKFLYDLKDSGKIISFKSECDTKKDGYKYTIKFRREYLSKLTDDKLIQLLGLESTMSETLIVM